MSDSSLGYIKAATGWDAVYESTGKKGSNIITVRDQGDAEGMARLKRESARTGRTMSELVETALRRLLQSKPEVRDLQPLPSFKSGGALVDVADREALYRAMEGR